MKQIKELRLEKGKKYIVILSSVCALLLLTVFGLRRMYKQELPRDFKSKYEFNSGVTTHEKTYVSTPAIYFPEIIRQKGDYLISNETGYQVCVATPEDGFLFLEQGIYQITGKPLVFFIVQPQGKENAMFKGELGICERNKKTGFKYYITGNERKIKKMRFYTEII